MTSMLRTTIFATLFCLCCAGCRDSNTRAYNSVPAEVTFKPKEMADALHAVIAADRLVYSQQIIERFGTNENEQSLAQTAHGTPVVPLPSRMLRLGSEEVQKNGAEFHYVLRSLNPLDLRNAPQTSTEQAGLEFVASHPESNFYAEESLGGRRYLTAVYRDMPLSGTCANCHNQRSNQTSLKPGDIIGGIIVRVPLEF